MNPRIGTSLSRRNIASMFAAMILAIAALFALSLANVTEGASGDKLREFDPAEMTCPYGSSVAFDGTQLYSSCWDSNVLYRISSVNGSAIGTGQAIAGVGEIGAMAWDSGRGKLWICDSNHLIKTISTTMFVAQLMFDTIPQVNQGSCRDGLAYDRADDTVWLSGDGDSSIYHFTSGGALIATYTPGPPVGGGSGLAVSGSTVYVANPDTGVIYACDKTFTSCSVTVASAAPTGHPTIEDLECDSRTFAPKDAIWNESQGDPYMTAWEVPASSCVTGGGPPVAVGGVAALSVSSSGSPVPWIPLAAVGASVMAVLGVGLWYGRRRWLR